MTGYLLGLLTVPGSCLLIGLAYLTFSAGRTLWARTHNALVEVVHLRKNLPDFTVYGPEADPERPEYEDAANMIRDVLIRSPKLVALRGLGWNILFVRDYKTKEKDA